MPTKRQSIRLRNFDYGSEGGYFITICTYRKWKIFGHIDKNKIILNDWGIIVQFCLLDIANHFKHTQLDTFIIMPNHIHMIITINCPCRGTACRAPTVEQFGHPVSGSLPTIIRSFKSAVTKQINILRHTPGVEIWQRNYHEHIIRNELELNQIRRYIIDNPANWDQDEENIQLTCPILGV